MKAEILQVMHMGGYAFYVWSAYLSATVILSTIALQTWRRGHQLRQEMSMADRA